MSVKEYDIKDFKIIKISGAMKIEIIRSDYYNVRVDADDFEHIRVEKEGDVLMIGRRGIDWLAPFHIQPEVQITMPVLSEMTMSGASRGSAAGFNVNGDFVMELSGASHFELREITAINFRGNISGASHISGSIQSRVQTILNVSGASHVTLSGSTKELELEANGASHADLEKYIVESTDVKLSGASHGTVNINGRLNARLTGASDLAWIGTAAMGDIETTGASKIRKK